MVRKYKLKRSGLKLTEKEARKKRLTRKGVGRGNRLLAEHLKKLEVKHFNNPF